LEELYHVDEDDSVLGAVMRDDAHKREVLHRAGMVFVMRRDGKILLTKRSPSKDTFPDSYDCSCAFHVTFGETYEEAAKRELLEEIGIQGLPKYLGKFSFHEPPEKEMVAVFRCVTNQHIMLDKTESTDARFYSIAEVDRVVADNRVTPWLRDGWKLVRDQIL